MVRVGLGVVSMGVWWLGGSAAAAAWGCEREAGLSTPAAPATPPGGAGRASVKAAEVVIESAPGTGRPPFAFAPEDERLLDEVQRGAFKYLWEHICPETGMVFDRSSKDVISVAGVGFQLSGIPVGVERGWITREEGEERAGRILRALAGNPENRRAGLFYHYLAPGTAGPTAEGYEVVVSTIDSALLMAGIITAGEYFGGEVGEIAGALVREADWAAFVSGEEARPHERGFISLGWKPEDPSKPTGPGALLPYYWVDSGDEHRLVTFLAVCAPDPEHRVDPAMYYRLRRQLGEYGDTGPLVWFPWSVALFTAVFAHCWIDYGSMGPDDPAAAGVARRARVDWWENSRRLVQMHRIKARENPKGLPTLGEDAWGLTAGDAASGYQVPGLFPDPIPFAGGIPNEDFAPVKASDNWGDGTISPYGAGSAIMFEPRAAVAAMRFYKGLEKEDGSALVWRDPGVEGGEGGCGFLDAFNLNGPWVAPDYVAIDQGPLLLSIENARTGMIWGLFHRNDAVEGGMGRLGLTLKQGVKLEND